MTNPTECRIYEFSTGIVPDFDSDGRWFSRRFTGNYMNLSLPGGTIPQAVETAIANELFQVVEGEEDQPAIVGRVVPGPTDYSVVALATRGRDEINRPIAVYRYFLCEGKYNLWKILAWFRHYQQQYGKLPTFNPADTRQEGDYFSPPTDSRHPNMTLDAADERLIAKDIPILIQGQQLGFHQVHILAINKAGRVNQPVSWAYNVEGLEKPNRFVIIHAASNDAYKQIKAQIGPVVIDEKALESAIKNITINGRMKEESVKVIAQGINSQQITQQSWWQLFNNQGADLAHKVSSPPMARLLTLRAMVIPESLPDFLHWIEVKKNQIHQETVLTFQSEFYHYVPREQQQALDNKLAAGITFVLERMLEGELQLEETVVDLLRGKKSAWRNCSQTLAQNITDDFYYLANLIPQLRLQIKNQIDSGLPVNQLKCNPVIWKRLLDGYNFKFTNRKKIEEQIEKYDLAYYLPLAQFLEKLRRSELAACFYQISQGEVPERIFIGVFRSENGLNRATELQIRREISQANSQLKLPSIILQYGRTWKDSGVITVLSLFGIGLFNTVRTVLFKSVRFICNNRQRFLHGIVFGIFFLSVVFLAPKLLNLAKTGINPWENIKSWFSYHQINVPGNIMRAALKSSNLETTATWIDEIEEKLLTKDVTQPNLAINQAVCLNQKQKCNLSLISAINEDPQNSLELKQQIEKIYLYQQARGIKPDGVIGPQTAQLIFKDAFNKTGFGELSALLDFELQNSLEKFDTTKAELSSIVNKITDDLQQNKPTLKRDDIKKATIKSLKTALNLEQVDYTGIIVGDPGFSQDKIDQNRKLWLEGINTFQLQLKDFAGQYGVITNGSQTSTELEEKVKSLVEEQLKELSQERASREDNLTTYIEMSQAKMNKALNSYPTTTKGIQDVVERTYLNIISDATLSDKLQIKFGLNYSNNSAEQNSPACRLKKQIVLELEKVLQAPVWTSSRNCTNLGNIPAEGDKIKWIEAIYKYQRDKVDTLVDGGRYRYEYRDFPANWDGILDPGQITANHLVDKVTEQFKQNLVAP